MVMSAGEEPRPRAEEGAVTIGGFRYVRAPRPLHFPESAEVPETRLHEELCALLRALLRHAFAKEHSVGGDQFIYWDPTDPRACLAADAFVRLGQPDSQFRTWRVWERGAPELAIEILSDSDADSLDVKLQKYARLGVRELVTFDPESAAPRLRVWDRLGADLVERELLSQSAASKVLPGHWLVVRGALRLSRDEAGSSLYPTPTEAEAEARQAEAEARQAETRALSERIRELEAELARRQG